MSIEKNAKNQLISKYYQLFNITKVNYLYKTHVEIHIYSESFICQQQIIRLE
jgi:hypothetical protein